MICEGCPFRSGRIENVTAEEIREILNGAPLSCHQTHRFNVETETCEGYEAFMESRRIVAGRTRVGKSQAARALLGGPMPGPGPEPVLTREGA